MKIKKPAILKHLIIVLFFIPLFATGQKIIFCEKVDKGGNPIGASTEFKIGEKGGFLKVLIRLNRKANTSEVILDVYRTADGKRTLENTIRLKINPFLTWFYKEITFFKEGEYLIYAFDEKDKMLATGTVSIKRK